MVTVDQGTASKGVVLAHLLEPASVAWRSSGYLLNKFRLPVLQAAKYFHVKYVFRKKAVFLEKTAKNPFVGGHEHFEGRGASGEKSQYNLFCSH